MAILKCKMCGGNLELTEGVSVVECEYCGTNQTVPNADDDKKMNLFARANRLRFACEFDKAAGIYESILADFPEEAEGYWGLVLCKYGIEYVDDPATAKKVPTCHRSSFESIMDDSDYEQALENADAVARSVYRNEAKQIEEIRKGIIEVSSKEEPYDIFICYKETAEDGQRTIDSVLAQDVYDVLTDKGYRTFFARITLEDKLGQEYEPYIFAALNSAKVMLAFGTDYEYFNAVWVKNEWSRYLKLMEKDKGKHLIPCYKGIDAYDIPKEFVRLQAQDLGKVGAVQDLVRGIEKLIGVKKSSENAQPVVVQQTGPDCESLLKRVFMFLGDGDWKSADSYCEKVLDINPETADAYLGKLMANLRVKKKEDLKNQKQAFDENLYYQKVCCFGGEELQKELKSYIDFINERNENERLEGIYNRGKILMNEAKTEKDCEEAAKIFESILQYKDAVAVVKECYEKAKNIKMDERSAQERFQELVVEFKVLSKKVQPSSNGKQLKKQVEQLTVKGKQLQQLLETFAENSKKLLEIEKALSSKKEKMEALQKERSSLGIFAGKQKKEIDKNIEVLQTDMAPSVEKATQLKAALCGCSSEEEVQQKIKETEEKLAKLQRELSESEKNRVGLVDVIAEICSEGNRKYLCRNVEFQRELFNHPLAFKYVSVGDQVVLGAYEQNSVNFNMKEPIEWIVLEKKDDKVLLISKHALDEQPYHANDADVTWEECTLRRWLNNEFLNKAFSEKEKAMISKSTVLAERNPEYYDTNPGNATQDKIFLLSVTEVMKYFSSTEARVCVATAYAIGKGAYSSANSGTLWWLRTPAILEGAATVFETGDVNVDGDLVNSSNAIRPALWVDLTSGTF